MGRPAPIRQRLIALEIEQWARSTGPFWDEESAPVGKISHWYRLKRFQISGFPYNASSWSRTFHLFLHLGE